MKSKWAQRNEAGIVRDNLLKPFAGDSPGVPFLHLKGSVVTPIHMFSHVKVSSVSVGSSPEGQFLVRFQWQPVLRAIFRGWTCIGYNYQRMIPNIKTLIYPGRFTCLRVCSPVSSGLREVFNYSGRNIPVATELVSEDVFLNSGRKAKVWSQGLPRPRSICMPWWGFLSICSWTSHLCKVCLLGLLLLSSLRY